jgi:hypothetical protein
VRAVGPFDAGLIHEFQPRVVHQLGGLQGVPRPLAPHQRARDSAELRVRGVEYGLECRGRTTARVGQQAG